jgi:hypothetical protein
MTIKKRAGISGFGGKMLLSVRCSHENRGGMPFGTCPELRRSDWPMCLR